MVRISTPAIVCALSIASLIERTVQSMFATIPLRRPRQGTVPTPRIVIPSAPSTSATTAQTFVVPMSRPTTISPCEAAVLIVWGNRMPLAGGPSFFGAGRRRLASAHADDDPIGAGVVVEHDGVSLGASLVELRNDARGLIELSPEGRGAEDELDGGAPYDQREDPVGLDVHLLQRRALRERHSLELRGQIDGAPDCAHRSLAVLAHRLRAKPGHERQGCDLLGRIADLELLERLALGRRQEGVAQRGQGGGPALGDVHDDR